MTAETEDGYNTTVLSRTLQDKLDQYELPDGYSLEIAGESTEVMDAMSDIFLMIGLAIALLPDHGGTVPEPVITVYRHLYDSAGIYRWSAGTLYRKTGNLTDSNDGIPDAGRCCCK